MPFVSLNALTPPLALAVWTATGPDARSFLQGQLTQDTGRLAAPTVAQATQHQLTGACTPKGRLLASLLQWAVDETALAQICPLSLCPSLVKRLRMYVLRSKLVIEEQPWRVQGVWLEGSTWPPGSVVRLSDRLWLLLSLAQPPGPSRGLLVGESDALEQWVQSQPRAIQTASESDWWTAEIRSGLPWVWPETQETFVPQMLNFDLLDGIGFKKGCYTGQEIVARSQYLGKLNRRMFLLEAENQDAPAARPGSDLFQSGQAGPVGELVMQQSGVALGSVGLETVQALMAGSASLHLGSAQGPRLRLGALPYPVPTEPQQVSRPRLG